MFKIILLVTTFACLNEIQGQTFQYSRGWTNGKRSGGVTTDLPTSPPLSLRQILPNAFLLSSNELNNRERLYQHIIKNPCDVRMALLATSHNNLKLPNDDFSPSAVAVESSLGGSSVEDDVVGRFKRELNIFP